MKAFSDKILEEVFFFFCKHNRETEKDSTLKMYNHYYVMKNEK